MSYDFIIIGAGLTGLSCAKTLFQANLQGIILEAEDRSGGRIRTDLVDGYKLDRGFQVLQTGYPEAARALDYTTLQLQSFPAGVVVRSEGRFHIIADPRKHFRHIFRTLFSPIGTIADKIRMLALTRSVGAVSFEELFRQPEEKTIDYLRNLNFSDTFIEAFFRPFFAGACLDRSITASSRVLRYIFRVFAQGDAALPAHGMEEIPRQLETLLPSGCIQYNSKVAAIEKGKVTLTNGESFSGEQIVLATSQPAAEILSERTETPSISESCIYFSTDWRPPFDRPFLVLNGENSGPINNLAFPSLVSPYYSPHGKTLIAAVILGKENCTDPNITDRVREQCSRWFGDSVSTWQHLRTYQIKHALPHQLPPTANPYEIPAPVDKTLRIAGESGSLPGIQWALLSGRKTAEAIIEDWQQ